MHFNRNINKKVISKIKNHSSESFEYPPVDPSTSLAASPKALEISRKRDTGRGFFFGLYLFLSRYRPKKHAKPVPYPIALLYETPEEIWKFGQE